MNRKILYGKTRTGKTKVWSAWVVEKGESGFPEIHYEWGMVDGKQQLTIDIVDKGVNEGKANETTPLEQAHLTLERKAKKKSEEGYVEVIDEVDSQEQTIDFSKPFPKQLCFYKPKNSIDSKKVTKLGNNAIYTVKRDGMMHIVRKTKEFGVEIYSRRMDLVTEKYPHLAECFWNLPDNTILLGEIILMNPDGTDNFNAVSQICRSDPDKAISRQEELGLVQYYIFDCAFCEGSNLLANRDYWFRYKLIQHLKNSGNINGVNVHVYLPEIINKSHEDALEETKERNLEGLVVWDKNGTMKDSEAFTFNGKAYRPNVLWKSKPKYRSDFIVRFDPHSGIGEYGNGKNKNKIKSVFIYQLLNGEEVLLGKCGGGLTDDQRDFYTTAEYPRVWEIEFDSIQQKTGSLRFPVFIRDRSIS